MQRRQTYHVYERDSSEAMGGSRKLIRAQTQAHWKAAGAQEREAWAFMRMVRERLYDMSQKHGAIKLGTCVPPPQGAALPNTCLVPAPNLASPAVVCKGLGMQRTFNPGWRNEMPELAHIMSDKRLATEAPAPDPARPAVISKGLGMLRMFNSGWRNEMSELARIMSDKSQATENKIKAMQELPALQEKFRRYEEHVKTRVKQHRLPTSDSGHLGARPDASACYDVGAP